MTLQARDCFFVERPENYFYTDSFQPSQDIFIDLKYMISAYSAGHDMEDVDVIFEQIWNHEYKDLKWTFSNIDDYYFASTLVSFFWLRAKNKDLQRLQELVPYKEDRLLTFIAEGDSKIDYSKNIYNMDPYVYLHNYVVEEDRSSANAETFLENFYFAFNGKSWFDSHKDNINNYFGYWSFSLAAIISKLDAQDVFFIDNIYYPRDLTGRSFMPTWESTTRGLWAQTQKNSIQKIYRDKEERRKTKRESFLEVNFFEFYKHSFLEKNKESLHKIFFGKLMEFATDPEKAKQLDNPVELKIVMRALAEDILMVDLDHIISQYDFLSAMIGHDSYLHIIKTYDISYNKEMTFLEKKLHRQNLNKWDHNILFTFFELAKDIIALDSRYESDSPYYWNELESVLQAHELEELVRKI